MLIALIAGIITGFVVSVPPLGPIAFAMISKGFKGELKEGMAIAMGSAFMDTVYALIAFGGISLFISLLPTGIETLINNNTHTLQIILTYAGCVVVIIYGLKIMKNKIDISQIEKNDETVMQNAGARAGKIMSKTGQLVSKTEQLVHITHKKKEKSSSLFGLFVMGIMLCISSITLPASWIALVGYVKSSGALDDSFLNGLIYAVGAFVGTVLWFWLLLKLITGNKHRINPGTLNKLNFIAGIILITLGAFLFVKATSTVFGWF